MVEGDAEERGDRLIVELSPGKGPVELDRLSESFAGLARMYDRHSRPAADVETPKLYVTKLSTGSIIAELAPYQHLFGEAVVVMAGMVTIGEFTDRLGKALKVFADPTMLTSASAAPVAPPSPEDSRDLRDFIKPLLGRKGATLSVKHARYLQQDGDRVVMAEYEFNETELSRAALNADRLLESGAEPEKGTRLHREVMLFFDSASRGPGKETGRTRDYAKVPEVSDKSLPVYFRSSVQGNLKERMVKGEVNPLTNVAFVVDVHVQLIDGEPRGYIVSEVHDTIDPAPEEER